MKIKVRPDHASTLQKYGWAQMGHRLAELRDDSRTEPPGNGHAEADSADDPWSAALAQAEALAEARAQARTRADALAEARARAEAAARAETETAFRAGVTVRAVIGDQLRLPIMRCEMGSCISWHADPAALGEADTRARAIGAGWRIDALGRLACPRCQQTNPRFWASRPVVPSDRHGAIARAARAAVPGDRTADAAATGTGRAASGYSPPSRAELEWHHDFPAAQAMPAGRRAENPAGTFIAAARS